VADVNSVGLSGGANILPYSDLTHSSMEVVVARRRIRDTECMVEGFFFDLNI